MNEYLFYQHRYNTVKTELCRLDGKAQRALTTALKVTLMKKHTALKQNIKKTTHALNLDAI